MVQRWVWILNVLQHIKWALKATAAGVVHFGVPNDQNWKIKE
jgi:hypothetical protein